MSTVLRTLAAIIAGTLAAFVLIVVVELISAVVHPLPDGFAGTKEEMCLHVERYPNWVLALVVPAWGVAAFVGSWIAQRIGTLCSFAIVAALLLAALVFNVSMLPYPMWFKIVNILVLPGAIVLGRRLAMHRKIASACLDA